MKLLVLFSLLIGLYSVESLKILLCFPMPVKSISILGSGVVRHLLNAGHEIVKFITKAYGSNLLLISFESYALTQFGSLMYWLGMRVTYITVYPMKNPATKNFRQIDISKNVQLVANDEALTVGYILEHQIEKNGAYQLQVFCQENARQTFQNENVQKLIQDPKEKFDVVIGDLLESEVYAGLAVLYDCPMIWLYSMGAHWQVLRLIDQGTNPAFSPDYLSPNNHPLSLMERTEELWARIRWQFLKTFFTQPEERKIYEETFGPLLAHRGRKLPDYEDVMYNASLIFGNEHNAIRDRPATPQNFKYIGGFHIEDPVQPLPKHFQDLIDNSKHGVIYFSMGSFLKSNSFPRKLVLELLNVFGQLKQTVIWKYEDDLPDIPKNVHIVNWAPQPSILAHPNVKIFITHGGLLSSMEAVHFGVPIIGVPVFFDQFTNINKAVANEYALRVNLNHDLPKGLSSAINVMLNDDRYSRNVKEMSLIYHHRLTKPGDEIVHWVEHVVRTRGAPHLRSPAFHVPLYQRLYLDLLAIILTALYVIMKLFGCFDKKKTKKNSQKKRN